MVTVLNLNEIAAILHAQGTNIRDVSDLVPTYLGVSSYVGAPYVSALGRDEVAWIRCSLGAPSSRTVADTAEWLTNELVFGLGLIAVSETIERFLKEKISRGVNEFDRLSVLAYVAHKLEFIEDQMDSFLFLPEEHPYNSRLFFSEKLLPALGLQREQLELRKRDQA